jgi:UDP-N-acetylmuramate dehydrogenase
MMRAIAQLGVQRRALGAGSNLLIADTVGDQIGLRLGNSFRTLESLSDSRLRVGAGMSLMTLSRQAGELGLSGLEFAGGIPAQIGGAVFMNAGAHGGEMASVLEEIELISEDGQLLHVRPSEFSFTYRHSGIPAGMLITGCTLKLTPGAPDGIARRHAECLAERRKRQPLSLPSAGSIFKNPSPDRPAGQVLEELGFKGAAVGGARISELHANWIVNPSRTATAQDVWTLIEQCRDAARQKCQLDLIPEIQRWG